MLQLVRGLQDRGIQVWLLKEAASVVSRELSLDKVTNFVEAAEMGKSRQASTTRASGLVEHRTQAGEGPGQAGQPGQVQSGQGDKSCCHCGQQSHGSGQQEQRDHPCPTFDIKCCDCWQDGHNA